MLPSTPVPVSDDSPESPTPTITLSVFRDARGKQQAERHTLRSLADLEALLRREHPRPEDKLDQPLMSRGEYRDPKAQRGTPDGPWLPVIDVDKARFPMNEVFADLHGEAGESCVVHESHTPGRYRIFGSRLCRTPEQLEAETRRLAAQAKLHEGPYHKDKNPDGQWDAKSLTPSQHFFVRTGDAKLMSGFMDSNGGAFQWADPVEAKPKSDPKSKPAAKSNAKLKSGLKKPAPKKRFAPVVADPPRWPASWVTPEAIASALKKIDVDDLPYGGEPGELGWIEVGQALHHAEQHFGLEGAFKLWDRWSSRGATYRDGKTGDPEEKWRGFGKEEGKGRPITLGSVFRAALSRGWQPPQSTIEEWFAFLERTDFDRDDDGHMYKTLANAVRAILSLDLSPAYDELGDRIMLLGAGFEALREGFSGLSREVDDTHLLAIKAALAANPKTKVCASFKDATLNTALDMVAHHHSFNPVTTWLGGLVWDGVPRIDSWLVDYCGCEDTPPTGGGRRIFPVAVPLGT